MKKVGIVSCYYHHNYGSMLQAYATQKIVEKLGYEAITVSCEAPITYMTQPKLLYYVHKLINRDIVKTKIRQIKSKIKMRKYPDIVNDKKIRDKCFDEFSENFFRLSKTNKNRADLKEFASTCDALIVGSDMLWHPVNVEHDYYTLTFVPDDVKKISYATSIGTTNIPKYQKEIYKNYLNRFHRISVREQSGIDVIKSLNINKEVQVVLDPTLLFTGKDWEQMQMSIPRVKEKYIFCYFLGVNREHRNFVNLLKKATGYKIVALQHLDEFVEADLDFADITPYDIGPCEFINLIKNAEYVCTDSFHGTCFSILNHRKFFTFSRFSDKNTQSTNTRIDSLLSITNLQNRRIYGKLDASDIERLKCAEINYDLVDGLLNEEREKSITYLKKALDEN